MITSDKQRFQSDGVILKRGFLDARELGQLANWLAEIESCSNGRDGLMHHFEQTASGARIARSEYLLKVHGQLAEFLTRGTIPAFAGKLLGEPIVLYKEKINYKYPGGGGYAPHQDAPAFDFAKTFLTCSIAIDPADQRNGCLSFAPGSERLQEQPQTEDGCIRDEFAATLKWEDYPLDPGDVLFFDALVPHRSGPNNSDRPRRSLYLTYNAADEGDHREQYYADKRKAISESPWQDGRVRISKIGHFQGKAIR